MEKQDKITVYDEFNNSKEYIVLAIIQNKYIVYTDVNNKNMTSNLLASKFKNIAGNIDLIPLNDEEWNIVESEYQRVCEDIVKSSEV